MGTATERTSQASVKVVLRAANAAALPPPITSSMRSITACAETFSVQTWPKRQRLSWRSKHGEQGTPARNAASGRP